MLPLEALSNFKITHSAFSTVFNHNYLKKVIFLKVYAYLKEFEIMKNIMVTK